MERANEYMLPGQYLIPTEEIIQTLQVTDGAVFLAADILGCSAETIYSRAKADPKVQEVIMIARGRQIDIAESSLKRATLAGEAWAVCFTLKTIGRSRGYVERVELILKTEKDRLEGLVNEMMLETQAPREACIDMLAATIEGVDIKGLLNP